MLFSTYRLAIRILLGIFLWSSLIFINDIGRYIDKFAIWELIENNISVIGLSIITTFIVLNKYVYRHEDDMGLLLDILYPLTFPIAGTIHISLKSKKLRNIAIPHFVLLFSELSEDSEIGSARVGLFWISVLAILLMWLGVNVSVGITTPLFLGYLILHYYYRTLRVFSYQDKETGIRNLPEWIKNHTSIWEITGGDSKKVNVLFVCTIVRMTRDWVNRSFKEVSIVAHFVLQVIYTASSTVILFFILYIQLENSSVSHFSGELSVFESLYFSLSHIVFVNTSQVFPLTPYAILLSSLEAIMGYMLLGFIFYGMVNFKIDEYKVVFEELRNAIVEHEKKAKSVLEKYHNISDSKYEEIVMGNVDEYNRAFSNLMGDNFSIQGEGAGSMESPDSHDLNS